MLEFKSDSETTLEGEWYVTSARLSKSGNHAVANLAKAGLKGEMIQVIDSPESLEAYKPGFKFLNPRFTAAVGQDLQPLAFAIVPPKGTDASDETETDPVKLMEKGWMAFHPVYFRGAESVDVTGSRNFGNALALVAKAQG